MLNQKNREPNFIEKRRQWKSKMEKPLSRRTLMMILPALILSVFVMMSAPYLKIIIDEFLNKGTEMSTPMELNIADEKKVEKEGPPPDPDAVLRQEYRDKLDAEGFDWRKKPELEMDPINLAEEKPIDVKPVDVELPNTMTELQSRSKSGETPSQ
ncbi:hypothetical protein [Pelagicoccus albus]|uniref:Uncharacterized protein n=1 Tax=Pelagicoccus albus TaxID=415222 RepID=A0A7X1B9H2_9BACT|nr:hypothetical protein [Pelagicoccus albus]MBC2606883.1 hypothetical protein [Pelagicoccus albus]